jgi:hypothetical protein
MGRSSRGDQDYYSSPGGQSRGHWTDDQRQSSAFRGGRYDDMPQGSQRSGSRQGSRDEREGSRGGQRMGRSGAQWGGEPGAQRGGEQDRDYGRSARREGMYRQTETGYPREDYRGGSQWQGQAGRGSSGQRDWRDENRGSAGAWREGGGSRSHRSDEGWRSGDEYRYEDDRQASPAEENQRGWGRGSRERGERDYDERYSGRENWR